MKQKLQLCRKPVEPQLSQNLHAELGYTWYFTPVSKPELNSSEMSGRGKGESLGVPCFYVQQRVHPILNFREARQDAPLMSQVI